MHSGYVFYWFGRNSCCDAQASYVSCYYGSGGDDAFTADSGSRQEYAAGADPDSIFNNHIFGNTLSSRSFPHRVNYVRSCTNIDFGGNIYFGAYGNQGCGDQHAFMPYPGSFFKNNMARTQKPGRGADTNIMPYFVANQTEKTSLNGEASCFREQF
ncbi:hypothetical protein RY72_05985 [Akkermansia muciniphila]|nr:hypothetical protein [Akkermansia muciniphila]